MNRITRIAVIGAGKMAREHCRVFSSLQDAEIAGIYSRTRPKAEALAHDHGIPVVCDSIESLWQQTKADLVLVTVNALDMLPVVLECAKVDWAIFMEKPPGHDLPAATSLLSCARDENHRLFVGLNRRYYAAVNAARLVLDSCAGPRYIAVCDQQSYAESRTAHHPEEIIGKMMYANSIHLVDYLRIFGRGEITQVQRLSEWAGEHTFVHSAIVFFKSGDVGRYDALWGAPGPWSCSVACNEKRVEMRPLESLTVQRRNERRATAMELDVIDTQFKAGFYRQAEDLLRAVRGEPSQMTTIEDAYEVMKLIHGIYGV